jgi:hypothetical protein
MLFARGFSPSRSQVEGILCWKNSGNGGITSVASVLVRRSRERRACAFRVAHRCAGDRRRSSSGKPRRLDRPPRPLRSALKGRRATCGADCVAFDRLGGRQILGRTPAGSAFSFRVAARSRLFPLCRNSGGSECELLTRKRPFPTRVETLRLFGMG